MAKENKKIVMDRKVLLFPVVRYEVVWSEERSSCFVEANDVGIDEGVLTFKNIYKNDDVEDVAMFHKWVYFIREPFGLTSGFEQLVRYGDSKDFPKDWGKVDGKEL